MFFYPIDFPTFLISKWLADTLISGSSGDFYPCFLINIIFFRDYCINKCALYNFGLLKAEMK